MEQILKLITTPATASLLVWVEEVGRHYLLTGKEDTHDLVLNLGHPVHLYAVSSDILVIGDYCIHKKAILLIQNENILKLCKKEGCPKVVLTSNPSVVGLDNICIEVVMAYCKEGKATMTSPIYKKSVYTRTEVHALLNKKHADTFSGSTFYNKNSHLTVTEFHTKWNAEHLI